MVRIFLEAIRTKLQKELKYLGYKEPNLGSDLLFSWDEGLIWIIQKKKTSGYLRSLQREEFTILTGIMYDSREIGSSGVIGLG
jgi:hypothetical protein